MTNIQDSADSGVPLGFEAKVRRVSVPDLLCAIENVRRMYTRMPSDERAAADAALTSIADWADMFGS
jgi:hypothetical protein